MNCYVTIAILGFNVVNLFHSLQFHLSKLLTHFRAINWRVNLARLLPGDRVGHLFLPSLNAIFLILLKRGRRVYSVSSVHYRGLL